MASFLVLYGTGEGQTAAVADRIETVLANRGHDVTVANAADDPLPDVETFDAVLVGTSVNDGRHRPDVVEFVETHRRRLSERPSAFFQLSITSAIPFRRVRRQARRYVDALIEETGWQPDRVGLFAGALKYSQYDARTRRLFKWAARLTRLGTDTSRDYEYTDWEAVEAFATEFAELVERRAVA